MTAPLQLPKPPPTRRKRGSEVRIVLYLLLIAFLAWACAALAGVLGAWLTLPLFPT